MSALTDFIENGLYDPAFAKFDPRSPKTFFQLSPIDVTYSKYRPDLAALGATDGRPPSGMPPDNDDPLSRRDMGLEFLDVTGQVSTALRESERSRSGRRQEDEIRLTNHSSSIVDTHLLVIVKGLPKHVSLANASGTTGAGTVNLFSKTARSGYGVFGHSQVIEDETGTEAKRSHQLGDRLSGFLE